jgi:hypothetical protein
MAWYTVVSWATWPVHFPVGKDVTVRTTYTQLPRGWRPTGDFTYVLQTGGGWNGTIGEGTVTFRLPYPVSFENARATSWLNAYRISGNDVIWHFNDLEPTADNNVTLCVMEPSRWTALMNARDAVQATPKSAAAQLQIAVALARMTGSSKSDCADESLAGMRSAEGALAEMVNLAPTDRQDLYALYAKWFVGGLDPRDMLQNRLGIDPVKLRDRKTLLKIAATDFKQWPDDPVYLLVKQWIESPDYLSYVEPPRTDYALEIGS